jgi:hypothetical protein
VEIAALRALIVERRAPRGYRASAVTNAPQIERIAQVSYDAGERGILELLDARIGSTARVRQAALDAAVRRAEIELERERLGDSVMRSRSVLALLVLFAAALFAAC